VCWCGCRGKLDQATGHGPAIWRSTRPLNQANTTAPTQRSPEPSPEQPPRHPIRHSTRRLPLPANWPAAIPGHGALRRRAAPAVTILSIATTNQQPRHQRAASGSDGPYARFSFRVRTLGTLRLEKVILAQGLQAVMRNERSCDCWPSGLAQGSVFPLPQPLC